jgi:hypothetical protein
VYQIPERFDKRCPVILVIEIICMLPDIESHQDPVSRNHIDIVLLKLHDEQPPRIHTIRQHCPTRSFDT